MTQYPSSSNEPPAAPGGAPAQRMVRVSLPALVPYVSYGILGITVLVYLLQLISPTVSAQTADGFIRMDLLQAYGGRIKDAIRAGELWRLLTPMLLHASPAHIAFNMYALWIFGPGLERNYGHWRLLLLYVLAGFSGNVLSFLFSPAYLSVGASTAIFGLVSAEGIFLYQNRKLFGNQFSRAIGNIILVVGVNLLLGLTPGIDNWGHIGGLLGGLIFAWFAGPVWEVEGLAPSLYVTDKREPRSIVTGAAIVILIFGALAVWGMVAPIRP